MFWSAGGIGKLVAEKLLNLGCVVVLVDLNQAELKKIEDKLKKVVNLEVNRVFSFQCDLSSLDDIKKLAANVKENVGPVHILVNNAGIMNHGKLFEELTHDEIVKIFQVNALAQLHLTREFLPQMKEKNFGHIVNVASICGIIGGYKIVDYCASKFAVVGFTESLRIELNSLNKDNKIVVSVVCPFHVRTNLFNGVEFSKLKWLNLSMEPEYVASDIVNGILANKEMILIPKAQTSVFVITK